MKWFTGGVLSNLADLLMQITQCDLKITNYLTSHVLEG